MRREREERQTVNGGREGMGRWVVEGSGQWFGGWCGKENKMEGGKVEVIGGKLGGELVVGAKEKETYKWVLVG